MDEDRFPIAQPPWQPLQRRDACDRHRGYERVAVHDRGGQGRAFRDLQHLGIQSLCRVQRHHY